MQSLLSQHGAFHSTSVTENKVTLHLRHTRQDRKSELWSPQGLTDLTQTGYSPYNRKVLTSSCKRLTEFCNYDLQQEQTGSALGNSAE